MFKRAKRKIVISILVILASVLVGTLGLIYIFSYLSVVAQDYEVLKEHAEQLTSNQDRKNDNDGNKDPDTDDITIVDGDSIDEDSQEKSDWQDESSKGHGKMQRHLELGTFYSVRLFPDGGSIVIENGAEDIYTDEELITFAASVSSNEHGKSGELLYIVTSDGYDTIVCFMDNTVFSDSFSQIFLFTLLFGVIAMIAITFISIRIAKRIVSPMEETYQKQKQFTADAGHELKTPIAAMAANIELLHREIGENEWLDNIGYENERMQNLVTELLELARNENKTVDKKPVELSRLVESVILPLEAGAFEKNILIESEIAENITVNIDENGINQLVTILVDNALSHTQCADGEIGKINIRLSEAKGSVVLAVSNPGEEIPEEERTKLFERFYRTDSSHEFNGHYGLGLAIAKSIADANNVKLTVACNDGLVTFTAVFPAK